MTREYFTTRENFTRRGIQFAWNRDEERYEGKSQECVFYVTPAFPKGMWDCFVYIRKSNQWTMEVVQWTMEVVGASFAQFSKEEAVDVALEDAIKHFELEQEVVQFRLNDIVNCLKSVD